METKPKILAVDDTRTNLRIIKEALGDGFQLACAANGEEALEIAPVFAPDVILLDIMMPGIDGYEACRQIRAHPSLQDVKVIMVSSRSSLNERLEAYRSGADDYLIKPFEHEELLAKLRVYLRLKSAEEVDRLKTDVIALLSHEMRTPLTTMLGPAKMLMEDELDPVDRKQLARLILLGARRLHGLIEKAQLLGSLWSGTWKILAQPVDLGSLLRPSLEKIGQRGVQRDIEVLEELDECPPLMLDPRGIQQVISSILDNALSFSPDGGRIRVRLSLEDDRVALSVSDEGEGIRPEFIPRVFDAFAKDDIHHHTRGHGLSMAIARQIVRKHRGTIDVESELGKGTTFRVVLPLTAPAESHAA